MTEKFLTVAGAVDQPVTLRVPVGVTLAQCVAAAGGATIPDPVYVVGGVMMGRVEDDVDALVDKTTGGVIVLPGDHIVVRRWRRTWKQIAAIGRSACDQCSFCTELCPRYLLGHPIEPHRAMRSLEFNLVGEANVMGTAFCCECNLCSHVLLPRGPGPEERLHAEQAPAGGREAPVGEPAVQPARPELHMDNRKAPMQRLMQKLGLTEFPQRRPAGGRAVATASRWALR